MPFTTLSILIIKKDPKPRVHSIFVLKKCPCMVLTMIFSNEIKKFPFMFQKLIVKEARAVINRLEKGKVCQVFLLSIVSACFTIPCKHIFQEHMYGNKLLTAD